jgi:repressor LexA
MYRMSGKFLTRRQKEILDFMRDFRADSGVSPTHREICEHFGYSSYGTVHKHLKLLEQKGYLKRHWNQKRGVELTEGMTRDGRGAVREIPFFGAIAAGRPIEAVAGNETLAVPHHLLNGQAGEHYVLTVIGDSMIEEGIHDGDLVIVVRREEAQTGEMVVALVDHEATLKRFYPEGPTVRLLPSNAALEPIRIPASQVAIQGVVVGLMRRF